MMSARTTVVNIQDTRAGVYIGRGPGGRVGRQPGERGYFGSPFPLHDEREREAVVARYRTWFERRVGSDPVFRREVLKLRGKQLICFCAPRACHGQVIAEWVDAQPADGVGSGEPPRAAEREGRRCCCHSRDAAACLNLREKGFYVPGRGVRDWEGGPEEECSCACHAEEDEDIDEDDDRD